MMVGQPMVLIATDTQTAPSLPGVTHFNFGPPVINEIGHVAFIGEVRGADIPQNPTAAASSAMPAMARSSSSPVWEGTSA
jgi:hypothetical protein